MVRATDAGFTIRCESPFWPSFPDISVLPLCCGFFEKNGSPTPFFFLSPFRLRFDSPGSCRHDAISPLSFLGSRVTFYNVCLRRFVSPDPVFGSCAVNMYASLSSFINTPRATIPASALPTIIILIDFLICSARALIALVLLFCGIW